LASAIRVAGAGRHDEDRRALHEELKLVVSSRSSDDSKYARSKWRNDDSAIRRGRELSTEQIGYTAAIRDITKDELALLDVCICGSD
jgi:hypothetical protein